MIISSSIISSFEIIPEFTVPKIEAFEKIFSKKSFIFKTFFKSFPVCKI